MNPGTAELAPTRFIFVLRNDAFMGLRNPVAVPELNFSGSSMLAEANPASNSFNKGGLDYMPN